MALNFPSSPTENQEYTSGGVTISQVVHVLIFWVIRGLDWHMVQIQLLPVSWYIIL